MTSKLYALLFHGLTGEAWEMDGLRARLESAGIPSKVIELSGHAATIEALKRVHTHTWLDEAKAALAKLPPEVPLVVIGLSFGSLLALYLAEQEPQRVKAVVMLSPPIKLRSKLSELALKFCSLLPEKFLTLLPAVPKSKRDINALGLERRAYSKHSVGAAARVVKIRRWIFAAVSTVKCPVLLLQDPNDHHLSALGIAQLKKMAPNLRTELHWIPGGEHELTLGHAREKVFELICDFIKRLN